MHSLLEKKDLLKEDFKIMSAKLVELLLFDVWVWFAFYEVQAGPFTSLQIEYMIVCVWPCCTQTTVDYCNFQGILYVCVCACVCLLPRGWVGGQVSLCSVVIILFIFIQLWVVIEVCVNFWLVCFILCPFFLFWEAVSLSSSSLPPFFLSLLLLLWCPRTPHQ